MTNLYLVSTPIGNLEDISKRAIRILSEVDLILCEDTRTTQKLLNHYSIKKPLLSYHQHSKIKKIETIVGFLKGGKDLALVSDAGTPGISDPGNKLIDFISQSFDLEVKIIPIPGPSATLAAASISGFPMEKFLFLGFLPLKKKRNKFLKETTEYLIKSKYPIIFYESPYRIIKTLEDFKAIFSLLNHKFKIVVCRELTKKFETIYRGEIEKVIQEIKKDKIKGEFTVIINLEK